MDGVERNISIQINDGFVYMSWPPIKHSENQPESCVNPCFPLSKKKSERRRGWHGWFLSPAPDFEWAFKFLLYWGLGGGNGLSAPAWPAPLVSILEVRNHKEPQALLTAINLTIQKCEWSGWCIYIWLMPFVQSAAKHLSWVLFSKRLKAVRLKVTLCSRICIPTNGFPPATELLWGRTFWVPVEQLNSVEKKNLTPAAESRRVFKGPKVLGGVCLLEWKSDKDQWRPGGRGESEQ